MPRLARLCPKDIPQHIIQRGNNRSICFCSEDGLAFYTHCLKKYSKKFEVDIHAWVFMTNHAHLLGTPKKDGAVSLKEPKGFGRIRMRHIPDASGDSLVPFVSESVNVGSVVQTDGWRGYNQLQKNGYLHQPINLSSESDPAHVSMPGVHRTASLLKRWILGTHQGSASTEHLQSYLEDHNHK